MTKPKMQTMTAYDLANVLGLTIRDYRTSDGGVDETKITVRASKGSNAKELLSQFVSRTGLKVFRRKDKRVTEGGKNLLVFFHKDAFEKVKKVKLGSAAPAKPSNKKLAQRAKPLLAKVMKECSAADILYALSQSQDIEDILSDKTGAELSNFCFDFEDSQNE